MGFQNGSRLCSSVSRASDHHLSQGGARAEFVSGGGAGGGGGGC